MITTNPVMRKIAVFSGLAALLLVTATVAFFVWPPAEYGTRAWYFLGVELVVFAIITAVCCVTAARYKD